MAKNRDAATTPTESEVNGDALRAEGAERDTVTLALHGEPDGRYRIEILLGGGELEEAGYWLRRGGPWQVLGELSDGESILFWSAQHVGRVDIGYAAPVVGVADDVWRDWAYVKALMDTDAPIYAADDDVGEQDRDAFDAAWKQTEPYLREGRDPEAGLSALTQLVGYPTYSSDSRLGMAAEYAARHKDGELAVAFYRRYQPMGRCSMDTTPQLVASEYAALCHQLGRLGCYLQLHVQIMSDRFNRVAWSSWGEQASPTHAEALEVTGVDPRRFLRGLLFRFATELKREGEVGPWRLARAIVESGYQEPLRNDLETLAADPRLDELNRFRAAVVLTYVLIKLEMPRAEVKATIESLDLAPTARRWIDGLNAE